MNLLHKAAFAAAPVVLVGSAAMAAVPQVPQEEGVRGYLAAGIGYTDIESSTTAGTPIIKLDNDRIQQNSDLNNSPDGRDTAFPALLGEVTWTIGNRNQFFFGTSVEDAVTLDGGTRGGWRKSTDNIGTFEVSAVLSQIAPRKDYADPFLTDEANDGRRRETDRTSSGIRFDWDRIIGGLGWQVQYREIDIDKERSGDSLVGQIAPSGSVFEEADKAALERDADELTSKLYYTFKFDGGHELRPLVGYRDRDADGDAEDFDSIFALLSYGYRSQDWNVAVNAGWTDRDYDNINPVFGAERDADGYVLDLTVFRNLDIGDGNWAAFFNAAYGELDSDVDFYDTEMIRAVAGMAYFWK